MLKRTDLLLYTGTFVVLCAGCGDKPLDVEPLPNGWQYESYRGKSGVVAKPDGRGLADVGCPRSPGYWIDRGDLFIKGQYILAKATNETQSVSPRFILFDTVSGVEYSFDTFDEMKNAYLKQVAASVPESLRGSEVLLKPGES